uniref:ATP-dependent protease n=1 Tax=Mimivirus LCMiAC02 TaxID=2506609 RepID=A0A481Z311_9VIRU|nr:MAG: ATP-dependent protease [Mimivirus LCMiAC02]
MTVHVKDYKIRNLNKKYNDYSYYLINYQSHINKCYTEYIISTNEKYEYLAVINHLLMQMSNLHNTNIKNICESKDKILLLPNILSSYGNISNNMENSSHDSLINIIDIYKMIGMDLDDNKYQDIYNDPLDTIKSSILDQLSSKIGFINIKEGLSLLIGKKYSNLYKSDILNQIDMYNNIFIPLNYKIVNINKNDKLIFCKKKELKNDVVINNGARLYINIRNISYIAFDGYFINDNLNIHNRISNICYEHVYNKKKALEKYVLMKKNIDNDFIQQYFINITIGEIIISEKNNFLKQVIFDYNKYKEIKKMSFLDLVKEFKNYDKYDKHNIKKIFTIIKLLLFGSEKNINNAKLIINALKAKKTKKNYKIYDIINKNLDYCSKIKLCNAFIKDDILQHKNRKISVAKSLKNQIIACEYMPNSVKEKAMEKTEELEMLEKSGSGYYKQKMYIQTLLKYPWIHDDDDDIFTNISKDNKKCIKFLENVENKLNEKVFGHDECKKVIIELMGKWIINPNSSGTAIGLSGPPGIGKTLIATALGDALNIPFIKITLGGQNDGDKLHGHGYTYTEAQPGDIVKKMCNAGRQRCIIYFDELDKVAIKKDINEIYGILNHVVDSTTNKEIQDRFFQEIDFPLNKVLFVFSYNNPKRIDNSLLDRLYKIPIGPFTSPEKIIIANKFIIPEMVKSYKFIKSSKILSDNSISYIIDKYTNEDGVRDLKRKIESLFLGLNINRIKKSGIYSDNIKNPKNNSIVLSIQHIKNYLGDSKIHITRVNDSDMVGVINGLFTTDKGNGGILPIQIYNNDMGNNNNKFTLEITGNQLRTMTESIKVAFTTATHHINKNTKDKFFNKHIYGFHINNPGGGVDKDGPSAGCAFTVAFISRIINKKIRHDIAMTGEIELTGKISKIGGLVYKLIGAKKAGVKLVLVPIENELDILNIKKKNKYLFDNNFNVKLVSNLREVLEYAIVDFDKKDFN